MSTVVCPNKACGKEVSDEFNECPFCGTPLYLQESQDPSEKKDMNVKRSKWYTYAKVLLILCVIIFCVILIVIFSHNDVINFLDKNDKSIAIWIGCLVFFSLICAIVQLLAGIKHSVDNLLHKNKKG